MVKVDSSALFALRHIQFVAFNEWNRNTFHLNNNILTVLQFTRAINSQQKLFTSRGILLMAKGNVNVTL